MQTMFGHAHVAGISKFRLKAEAQRTELSWIWTAEPEFTEHTNPCGSSSARGTLLLNFSNQEWAVRNSCMLCLCRHEAKRTTATSASLGSAASAVLGAMRPYIAGGESRQCVSISMFQSIDCSPRRYRAFGSCGTVCSLGSCGTFGSSGDWTEFAQQRTMQREFIQMVSEDSPYSIW